MKLHAVVLAFWLFFVMKASARDRIAFNFIQHFVANEMTSTVLTVNNLCWSISIKVKLANELSKAGHRSANLLKLSAVHFHHNHLFLVDLSCPDIENVLENAIAQKLFSSPFRWLVLVDPSSDDQRGITALFKCPLLPDSDLVLAERVENGFIMTELHRTSANSSMIFTSRGHYNGKLTDVRPHRELYRRRRDLRGHTLTMSNVIQDSNSTLYHLPMEDRLEPQFDSISKICWMCTTLLFKMLNATPHYIFNHRYGFLNNGTWLGMVGDVASGLADLGTNLLLNHDRIQVVTYTDMMAPFELRFVFRQPPLSHSSNIFSLPFSSGVWLSIVMCSAVAAATLYLSTKWETRLEKSPSQLDGSIGDALLLTMSAVGQQGCYQEPTKLSGRIITWVFFAALMLLYAAYSANIVVLLQAPSNSIRTLAQLASSGITLAAHDVDYNHFVFKRLRVLDQVYMTIFKSIEQEKGKGQFYELAEGVESIRQGLFAFHAVTELVYRQVEETFLEAEKCDLTEVDFMNALSPAVPVTKNSPYIELIKVGFKQIREAGLQSALVQRMQVPRPRCATSAAAFSSVGWVDMRPVLLFMVFGFTLALGIAALEVIVFHFLQRRRRYAQ